MKKIRGFAVLAAAASLWAAFPVLAAPTGPGAPPEPERYDARTLERLQDNRIEYDEIGDLVHEYNPNMSVAWDTYMSMKDDYANMVTELESQYWHVKETTDAAV